MSQTFLTTTNQEIIWNKSNVKSQDTLIVDANTNQDLTNQVIANNDAFAGWSSQVRIAAGDSLILNLRSMPIRLFGRTIFEDFLNIRGFAIQNDSLETIYVGNSGITEGVDFAGYATPVGPSGLFQVDAPLGIQVDDSQHNVCIINTTSSEQTPLISIVGLFMSTEIEWSQIVDTPITLAGYGITDNIAIVTGSPMDGQVLVWSDSAGSYVPSGLATTYLKRNNNLSDIQSSGTALTNLGVTTFAKSLLGLTNANSNLNLILPSQTGNSGKVLSTTGSNAAWVAASGGGGVGDLLAANNLSDLENSGTALTNLGLSTFFKSLVDNFTPAELRANLGLIFNAPNGVPQLDSDGNIVANIVLDSDTTANLNALNGSAWTLRINADTKELVLYDGNRYGGIKVGVEDSPTILTDGVAYYKFDNTIGTSGDATDYYNSNTLTNPTGAIYASGLLNNGVAFNGNDYLYSMSSDFNISGDIGISFWAKINAFPSGGIARLVEYENSVDVGYAIAILDNGAGSYNMLWGHTNGGVDSYVQWSPITWASGIWHHLAVTYDGTNLNIYSDGSSVATFADPSGAVALSNGMLTVGGSPRLGGYILDGEIDELLISRRSFSSAEVSLLYGSGVPTPLETLRTTSVQTLFENSTIGAYAAGSSINLTGSSAALTFSSSSPAITLPVPGKYRLESQVNLEYSAASFTANKAAIALLHRTNQGITDLPNSSGVISTGSSVTTMTAPLGSIHLVVPVYQARAGDTIKTQAYMSALPSAGNVVVNPSGTWLTATYLGE